MPKNWSTEQRAAARERILRTRPWDRSTGPRTAMGKRAASRNAWKHGLYARETYAIRAYIRYIRAMMVRARNSLKMRNELSSCRGAVPASPPRRPLHFSPKPSKNRAFLNTQRLRR